MYVSNLDPGLWSELHYSTICQVTASTRGCCHQGTLTIIVNLGGGSGSRRPAPVPAFYVSIVVTVARLGSVHQLDAGPGQSSSVMSGCAPPFLRNSLTNKTKLKIKMTDTTSQASTESLPGFFDQQIHNILVMLLLQLRSCLTNFGLNFIILCLYLTQRICIIS